jgi:hypothetical protein
MLPIRKFQCKGWSLLTDECPSMGVVEAPKLLGDQLGEIL